jgi:ABC-type Fe3+-hydroxamate transport system substrate-binding protein
VSLDQDSSDDYPEIGINTYRDSAREGHLIFMVAPKGDPSHHSSNRYPTIERSEASDAWTPNTERIRNLNPDFNVMRFQTIMESIQCIASEGYPLMALAQQGAEVVNLIVAERSVSNPQRESSVGN